jgi:GH24 family phage-related lysozyme (muramidase)
MPMSPLTANAQKLLFTYEGMDQPWEWPGGQSGITLGIGYDLGQCTADSFVQDWSPILGDAGCTALKCAIGVKGDAAKALAPQFRAYRVSPSDAEKVFVNCSAPKYLKLTEQAFPGVDKLPPDAQGALFSLVYNRGISMNGDSRLEMRNIRDAVAQGDLAEIAKQLRAMKRLWAGKNMDGLLKRRDAEAALVESCIAG